MQYQIELDLTSHDQAVFDSVSTVQFDCNQVGATTFIDLIAPEVLAVELNGQSLDVDQVFADSRISLPNLATHNILVVKAKAAYSHTGEGLHRFTDPVDAETYLYTQFEPADCRRVFAVFEQPDLKGTFQFTIKAPSHWTVLSNQPTASFTLLDPATTRHIFPPTALLSSYLTALCAGPWQRWDDQVVSSSGKVVPLGLYVRASLAQYVDAKELFDITKRGFGFYEPEFDYPYPFTKYDQVFCPEYNFGAMENAGLVTITEAYVFRSKPVQAKVERRALTILHELAHMWFGDLVTMRWWDDLWLNESFAEFASHLAAINATEYSEAWTTFAYSEKLWAYRQDQLPSTHPILASIENLEDVQNNFDGITYAKGASVLRQLVAWVGQEAFMQGLRTYFKKHAWSNTTLDDLLFQLEAASGRDLQSWAQAWLKTTGVATLRPTISGQTLTITQSAPQRPHRLGIGGYSLSDGKLQPAWQRQIDLEGGTVSTQLDQGPADLLLVNDQDLAYAKIRLDPVSLQAAQNQVGQITDSLARALVWGSLWDTVRSAELPASLHLKTIFANLDGETHSTAVQSLLGQVTTMLETYVDPARRLEATLDAADALAGLMLQAPAGSDRQLQLVKAFARHASSGAQFELVEGLLKGTGHLDGLVVETDLRWELLMCLVVGGRADQEAIDRQLAADPTASGHEQAAGLRAALPTEQAKRTAWQLAVEDPTTPNATQRHIIAGFNLVVDRTLLRPFVATYFDSIERIWLARSPEMAGNVAEGLYPSGLLNDRESNLLGRTSDFLAQLGDRIPPLRRLVVEGMDDVQRALKAQACDAAEGGQN
ncbi:MAG: aminopeptidase N [Micrococcales bacterium]|nr:aminopeptidase N [Micrococcales bacterium]